MNPLDVVALGELLIDFTQTGISPQGNPLWEANPGGAPCNVLAMLSQLGRKTAMIGKVGQDAFGAQLHQTLNACGIDTRNLVEDPNTPTTLAFVHNSPNGERSFHFYRNPGADRMLRPEDVQSEVLAACRIFHFGTLSSTHPLCRAATHAAVAAAKAMGKWISFDPNLREALWPRLEDAREEMLFGLKHCDILKLSEQELAFLTNSTDWEGAARQLQEQYPIPLILITLGKRGSFALYREHLVRAPAFAQTETIDTTGAGDTFTGCILHSILEHGLHDLSPQQIEKMLTFANAAAARITTRKGALKGMPSLEEIHALLAQSRKG